MDRIEEVEKIIKEKNLDAEVIRHPDKEIINLQSHLDLYGGTAEQVMKGLGFVSKGKFCVVIASGEIRIDTKKLRAVSGLKKPRMANEEELKEFLGTVKGGISPLLIPDNVPVFIDKTFMEKEEVVGSAGLPTAGLRIKPKELLKVIKAEVVDLKVE